MIQEWDPQFKAMGSRSLICVENIKQSSFRCLLLCSLAFLEEIFVKIFVSLCKFV